MYYSTGSPPYQNMGHQMVTVASPPPRPPDYGYNPYMSPIRYVETTPPPPPPVPVHYHHQYYSGSMPQVQCYAISYPSTSYSPVPVNVDYTPRYMYPDTPPAPPQVQRIPLRTVSHSQILSGAPKENCLVAKGRKIHVDHRTLSFEQLQPLLLPFKMSDSELETNAYPLFPAGSRVAKIAETAYTLNKKMFLDAHDLSRSCSRCQKEFKLNPDGTMVREKDICRYHHRGTNRNGKRDTFQKRYTCCNEEYNSTPGCKFSDVHVFDQLFKKDLSAFVPTPPAHSPNDYRSNKAYAIDCEMVYTVSGPALARLTMVNLKKEKVLDLFIKPPTEVLDPNTEFSGLTMEDIANAKDTMESCHQKLFQLVNSETILIGHSLESDLKAMRIVHKSVIDTAILFRSSGDFKIALKNLSSRLLGKTIQGDNEDAVGHDSLEDANTCVDLIFYGLKNPDSIVIRKLSS